MSRRFEAAYAAAVFKGILNRTVWDQVLSDVDARVADLENIRPELESAILDLTGVALGRINEVLTPAIASILEIVERGFLIASSDTTLTLTPTTGNIYTFVVPEGAERDLFTPSPYVTVSRRSDYHDYAIVRTIEYDKQYGEYVCEILETSTGGALGPFNDWVLSSGSGVSQAIKTMVERAIEARTVAEGVQRAVTASAAEVAANRKATADSATAAAGSAQAAATYARLAQAFDPTTYTRTTFPVTRFSAADGNLVAGQTVFTLPNAFTNGSARVFLKGAKLTGADFTQDGAAKTVTLKQVVAGTDVLEIETFYVNGIIDSAPLKHSHGYEDLPPNIVKTAELNTAISTVTITQADAEILRLFYGDFYGN